MIDRAGLIALVEGFSDPAADKSRELVLMLLRCSDAPFSRRQHAPGHITATACVAHPSDEAVLLIHHRRLDRWLLPGGHVEAEDAEAFATARREAEEETGVVLTADPPRLVGIDVHGIPSNGKEPYHLHHDLIVAFRAGPGEIKVTEETRATAWARAEEFDRYGLPDSIRRAACNALTRAR